MDLFTGFLMSMQAAGVAFQFNELDKQKELIGLGAQVQQSAYEANLEALNYQHEEASLASMQELRQNFSTQAATAAARGTSGSSGTVAQMAKSLNNYQSDERVRRMNLLSKEATLRANNVLSGLHTLESETALGQKKWDIIKQLPLSTAVSEFRKSDFAKGWGFGLEGVE